VRGAVQGMYIGELTTELGQIKNCRRQDDDMKCDWTQSPITRIEVAGSEGESERRIKVCRQEESRP
jgi:hypothetical protein